MDGKGAYTVHHDHLNICEDHAIRMWIRQKRNQLIDDTDDPNITADMDSQIINQSQDPPDTFNSCPIKAPNTDLETTLPYKDGGPVHPIDKPLEDERLDDFC